jgi:hypothetical protein
LEAGLIGQHAEAGRSRVVREGLVLPALAAIDDIRGDAACHDQAIMVLLRRALDEVIGGST